MPSMRHRPSQSIHDMPAEIMMAVFSYYDSGTILPMCHSNDSNTHIKISQVCRQWRNTVHSMSALWTRLSIYLKHKRFSLPELDSLRQFQSQGLRKPTGTRQPQICTCPPSLTPLDVWLRCSAGKDLSIFIDSHPEPLMNALFCSLNYWTVPVRLHVHAKRNDSCSPPPSVATQSKSISLTGFKKLDTHLPFLVKLKSLTSLTLEDLPVGNITSLRFAVLPNVTSLEIISQQDPMEHLYLLTLPALVEISLTSYAPNENHTTQSAEIALSSSNDRATRRSYSQLGDLIKRSKCKIKTFSVSERHMPGDYLSRYLSLPGLRHIDKLIIKNKSRKKDICTGLPDGVLELIRYPLTGTDSGYFPFLRHLELWNLASTDGLLAEVVLSRSKPASDGPPTPSRSPAPAQLEKVDVHRLGYDNDNMRLATPSAGTTHILDFKALVKMDQIQVHINGSPMATKEAREQLRRDVPT